MNARCSPGSHNSENVRCIFQIGAVFINKPQIWALHNYILAWNTLKITFCYTITVVFSYYSDFLRCYWLVSATCILGYLAVSSPHKSPLDIETERKSDHKPQIHSLVLLILLLNKWFSVPIYQPHHSRPETHLQSSYISLTCCLNVRNPCNFRVKPHTRKSHHLF